MSGNRGQLYIGIDGGGTKCRAICVDSSGSILGEGIAGPANPVQTADGTKQSIVQATRNALAVAGREDTPLDQLIVAMGLAGVNTAHGMKIMSEWQHPFKRCHIATDIEIAQLAAQSGADGAIIICGTGTVGCARVEGETHFSGGYGFPVADIGSGAWYGLEAVKQTLLELEGAMPPSLISIEVCSQLKTTCALEIASYTAAKPSSYFAKLANTVFKAAEQSDETAQEIIAEGLSYIEFMIDKLTSTGTSKVAMIGGLATPITAFLNDDYRARITTADHPPEVGSLFLLEREEGIGFSTLGNK